MSEPRINHCPKCGGIVPAGGKVCPRCLRDEMAVEKTEVLNGAEPEDTRIPSELITSAGKRQTIGPYEVIRKLGEGGMGTVYEAWQANLERKLALKVMSNRFSADASFQQRFEREAKAAASVAHPNLVHVYDYGEANGCHFIAMELVSGGSVAQLLKKRKRLPVTEAIDIIIAAAEALQAAQERGVVHRDIKPENLLIDSMGRVRVADLGLARQLDAESSVTLTGMVLGSPFFMAPEQAENASTADHRADIYSLGITLFYLVTGERPFGGSTALEVLREHARKRLPSMNVGGVAAQTELEQVVQRMTAKEPRDRYPDYATLISDLRGCRETTDGSTSVGFATPQNAQPRKRRYLAPSRTLLTITAVVCATLLAVVYVELDRAKRSHATESKVPTRVITPPPPVANTNPTELPRDHKSIFQRYEPIDFRWGWLPFHAGGPPRFPIMGSDFEENMKQAADFAAANPEKISQIIAHYRSAMLEEREERKRGMIEQQLNHWVAKETEAFEKHFVVRETRMKQLAQAKQYRDAYQTWSDFPSDYGFPRYMALIWSAITTHIPHEELDVILRERGY